MALKISERCRLQLLSDADVQELHSLIEANRERLAPWLRWAVTQTFDDTLSFIQGTEAQAAGNNGFQTAIVLDGRIAGMVGFTGVDWENRSTGIGYWLAARHEGKGIVTESVRALVEHAFAIWGLNRVEIRAAAENRRSRAIPERLGFQEEGILRDAERIDGRYLDSVVYSMLAADWAKAQNTGDSV